MISSLFHFSSLCVIFKKNECCCYCHARLRRVRSKHPKTSSAIMHRRLAAGPTSTHGRCQSASRCLLEITCWCPPPFNPTMRLTSWSGCSRRRRPALCECQRVCIRTQLVEYLYHSCEVTSTERWATPWMQTSLR